VGEVKRHTLFTLDAYDEAMAWIIANEEGA